MYVVNTKKVSLEVIDKGGFYLLCAKDKTDGEVVALALKPKQAAKLAHKLSDNPPAKTSKQVGTF